MSLTSRRAIVLLASMFVVGASATSLRANEPSAEYRAVLRRTIERRKEGKRARKTAAVGKIVPYPMPPSLIIRQTREVHGEVEGLLGLLRR